MRRTNLTNNYSSDSCSSVVTAVILAGGRSDRMNFPKPFLPYDSERTFVEKIIDEYKRFGCNEIILVLNEELNCMPWDKILSNLSKNVFIVYNRFSDLGRFYSLKLGIDALVNPDYCFIHNVDSPFIDSVLLKKLYESKTDSGYVVPSYKGRGGHPILIGRDVFNSIKEEGEISMNLKDKLRQFNRKTIDSESDNVLVNVNTMEEYRNLFNNDFLQKASMREC